MRFDPVHGVENHVVGRRVIRGKLSRTLKQHLGAMADRFGSNLGTIARDDQPRTITRLQRRLCLVSNQAETAYFAQILSRQSLRSAASDKQEQYLSRIRHLPQINPAASTGQEGAPSQVGEGLGAQ